MSERPGGRRLTMVAAAVALACLYVVPPSIHALLASPATPVSTPVSATTRTSRTVDDMHAWILQGSCTAAVLDTPSGSWLLTATHCATPSSVVAAGRTWTVLDNVSTRWHLGADGDTLDLSLLRVDGNIEAAVGGGFTVGTAPATGEMVSIWGYPTETGELTGCDDLPVTVGPAGLVVDACELPNGTSGSPWYTPDGVLHGVVGGPNEGGTSDWDTESTAFTDETVAWIHRVVD
ncbi:trypsin-like serine peptidase [Raineyella fluvialis]|uniref:Trypsin n=1 Tax=Raineyella fluvialis TaxID=2662261 RepID=A0A5Q2FAL9_9ACTN|nr:serine protease [Raineyella fluvialis]QGF23421.1 hypothetical protein Rai3103_06790 [Raineyella fluvialis]